MDRQREVDDLAKADACIAAGELRVTEQAKRTERLRAGGQDTVEADRLLALFHDTLRSWREHRDEIIRTIADIDAGRI